MICKTFNQSVVPPRNILNTSGEVLLKVYSLEPSERLALCRTAKHGSTTWAKNMMHIYLRTTQFVKGPKAGLAYSATIT